MLPMFAGNDSGGSVVWHDAYGMPPVGVLITNDIQVIAVSKFKTTARKSSISRWIGWQQFYRHLAKNLKKN